MSIKVKKILYKNKDEYLNKITTMHKENINDVTYFFPKGYLLNFYRNIMKFEILYGIFNKRKIIGYVVVTKKNYLILDFNLFLILIKIFFSQKILTLIEATLLYFWLVNNNFYKKNRYEYSYTVVDKKYQSKGYYYLAAKQIFYKLKKEENIRKLFIKTFTKDQITNFYKKNYNAVLIKKFLGRSISYFNL